MERYTEVEVINKQSNISVAIPRIQLSAEKKRKVVVIEDAPCFIDKKRIHVLMTDQELIAAKKEFPGLVFRDPEPGDYTVAPVTREGAVGYWRNRAVAKEKPVIGGMVGGTLMCRHDKPIGQCAECLGAKVTEDSGMVGAEEAVGRGDISATAAFKAIEELDNEQA